MATISQRKGMGKIFISVQIRRIKMHAKTWKNIKVFNYTLLNNTHHIDTRKKREAVVIYVVLLKYKEHSCTKMGQKSLSVTSWQTYRKTRNQNAQVQSKSHFAISNSDTDCTDTGSLMKAGAWWQVALVVGSAMLRLQTVRHAETGHHDQDQLADDSCDTALHKRVFLASYRAAATRRLRQPVCRTASIPRYHLVLLVYSFIR